MEYFPHSVFQAQPDQLSSESCVSSQAAQRFFQEVSYYGNSGTQPSNAEENQLTKVWNDLQNSSGTQGLAQIGQDLLKLEKLAGGPNSQNFQADLGSIGDIHVQGLPPIAIVGVTGQGQLILDEDLNGHIKTAVGDNSVGETMNSENLIQQLTMYATSNQTSQFNQVLKELEKNDGGQGGDQFALDMKVLGQQIYNAENPQPLVGPVLDPIGPVGPQPIGPIIDPTGPFYNGAQPGGTIEVPEGPYRVGPGGTSEPSGWVQYRLGQQTPLALDDDQMAHRAYRAN